MAVNIRQIASSNGFAALERADRQRRRWARSFAILGGLGVAAALLVVGVLLFSGDLVLAPQKGQESRPALVGIEDGNGHATQGNAGAVRLGNSLLRKFDGGITYLDSGLSVRQMRYRFIDRIVWEDPETVDFLEIEMPRDEIIFLPVQTL